MNTNTKALTIREDKITVAAKKEPNPFPSDFVFALGLLLGRELGLTSGLDPRLAFGFSLALEDS